MKPPESLERTMERAAQALARAPSSPTRSCGPSRAAPPANGMGARTTSAGARRSHMLRGWKIARVRGRPGLLATGGRLKESSRRDRGKAIRAEDLDEPCPCPPATGQATATREPTDDHMGAAAMRNPGE